jgi:opacity protein-like surface antigen
MAAPVFAGTQVVEPSYQPAPAPMMAEPTQPHWFIGASAGYLDEFEEDMYHLSIGYETGRAMYGWSMATFLEVGWTEADDSSQNLVTRVPGIDNQELEFIPVTLNLKFAHPIVGRLNAYMGAGAGVAFVDYGVQFGFGGDAGDDDEVFTGQLFAGLDLNIAQNFDLFAGVRWIYIDYDTPTTIGLDELQYGDDDFLGEIGMRISF